MVKKATPPRKRKVATRRETGGTATAPKKKKVKKKKAPPKVESTETDGHVRQQQFAGNGFPDPPPKEVADARDDYLQAMRDAAKASEEKGYKRERLIEAMRDNNIDRIKLDGENKFFELETEAKVKMKTIPKDQRDHKTTDD